MITLSTRSRWIDMNLVNTTLCSLLWHNLRPDDGPVQGPKHVCLVVKLHYPILLCLTLLPAPS